MVLLIALVWLMALGSGGVLAIGVISLVTGRLPFSMWKTNTWTRREGRQLGAVWTVVGGTYALYGLLGGIVLGSELQTRAPNPLFGHWWGFFVPMIPGLVLVGAGLVQLAIYNRHHRRVPEPR